MQHEIFRSLWKSKVVCVGTPVELHLVDSSTAISIVNVKDFPVSVRWLQLIKDDMATKPILEGHTQIIDHGISMFKKYLSFYNQIKTDPSKGILTSEEKVITRIELMEKNIASYNSQDVFQFMPIKTWCLFSGHIVCMWRTDGLWIVESMTQAYIDLLERIDPLLTATIKGLRLVISTASSLSVSGMSEDKLHTNETTT
jgi:hypothetical protein